MIIGTYTDDDNTQECFVIGRLKSGAYLIEVDGHEFDCHPGYVEMDEIPEYLGDY
ncbi:hypothetical protein MNBD_GAMMA12-1152 [hydrothermal vent metagenome]|uniref:Uncharacterized protein n=1 Tax=hydrothermal vent metagenome TaxID=652676 RepID=A0A3B0Z2X3_9ZZZZ